MTQIDLIKQLREQTGAGVMDAKRALTDADGDLNQAEELLRERGIEAAAEKSDRAAAAGIIYSYVHGQGQVGVLLELNCETSFVAKTDAFQKLAHEIALQITSMEPADVDELLAQEYIRDTSKTIEELVKEVVAETRENIEVGKFCRFEVGGS